MQVSQNEFYQWLILQYGAAFANHKFQIQPYFYPVEFSNLVAGGNQNGNVDVAANADFVILSVNYRASLDNGDATDTNGDVVPKVKVLITDQGSSFQMSSSAVDIATFMGKIDAAPFQWPWLRMVSGRSALTVAVTSYAGTDIYKKLTLTFFGMLVQDLGPMGPGDVNPFLFAPFSVEG